MWSSLHNGEKIKIKKGDLVVFLPAGENNHRQKSRIDTWRALFSLFQWEKRSSNKIVKLIMTVSKLLRSMFDKRYLSCTYHIYLKNINRLGKLLSGW